MFYCAVWGCTWVGWLTGKKESLTEEEEICVLSVAAVMDPGYPVAISSHVDQSHPLSLPLSNNLSRNIVCRAISDYNSTQSHKIQRVRLSEICLETAVSEWHWLLFTWDVQRFQFKSYEKFTFQHFPSICFEKFTVQHFPFISFEKFTFQHFPFISSSTQVELLSIWCPFPFPHIFARLPTFTKVCIAIISPTSLFHFLFCPLIISPFHFHLSPFLFSSTWMPLNLLSHSPNQLEDYGVQCASRYRMHFCIPVFPL